MQALVDELQSKEHQLRNRLEGLGRLMSLLATKVAEALRRYEVAQVWMESEGSSLCEMCARYMCDYPIDWCLSSLAFFLQIHYARVTEAHDKVEAEAHEARFSSVVAGEGFQRLDGERQLRNLLSELESALMDLQDADRRASMVTAVREAMTDQQVSGGHQIQVAADGFRSGRLTGGGWSSRGGSEPHGARGGSHDWNDSPATADYDDDGKGIMWSLGPMG